MADHSARVRLVEAEDTLGEGGPVGSSLHWPLRDEAAARIETVAFACTAEIASAQSTWRRELS
jgi:hypothetical protein